MPEFSEFLGRAARSKDTGTRVWALARLVEAGDLTRYPELAKDLAEYIKSTVLAHRGGGSSPFRKTATGELVYSIHHSSPFFKSLTKTVQESPDREVPIEMYVVWCYNTLPDQRELIYEIAGHTKSPVSPKNLRADPWNDPRFWIVTDWALAWGEAEDFENLSKVFQNSRAKAEFDRIARAVISVPGFFACQNLSPLSDRVVSPPAKPPDTAALKAANTAVVFDFSQIKIKEVPPTPRYPVEAMNRRMMANVEVVILLDHEGKVCGARTVPGPFLAFFAPVALEYASRWTFDPAKVNGVPVSARFALLLPFRLK